MVSELGLGLVLDSSFSICICFLFALYFSLYMYVCISMCMIGLHVRRVLDSLTSIVEPFVPEKLKLLGLKVI